MDLLLRPASAYRRVHKAAYRRVHKAFGLIGTACAFPTIWLTCGHNSITTGYNALSGPPSGEFVAFCGERLCGDGSRRRNDQVSATTNLGYCTLHGKPIKLIKKSVNACRNASGGFRRYRQKSHTQPERQTNQTYMEYR